MNFSHVFITRPRREAEELAALLEPLGLTAVIQPAFDYRAADVPAGQSGDLDELERAGIDALLVFSSPRAVKFGLPQLPAGVAQSARIAAIGPATARALEAAGVRVGVSPRSGYTSEALLETLESDSFLRPGERSRAYILAAPGGRQALNQGLTALGWPTRLLRVYRAEPTPLERAGLDELANAESILSVWTSANAMKSLSQRMPPAAWFAVCRGEWLVISERLKRLARAYGPAKIHLARGPGNTDLLTAVRGVVIF